MFAKTRPYASVPYITSTFRNLLVAPIRPSFLVAASLSYRKFHTSNRYQTDQKQISQQRPDGSVSEIFSSTKVQPVESTKDVEVRSDAKEYHWSSANFKVSPQKLNMLARQIRGLPVQKAITQMEFSNKRVSSKILHNLAFARSNAEKQKGMVPKNLVVAQAWVGKGKYIRRIKIHARSRFGIIHRPSAHIKFILKEENEIPSDRIANKPNLKGWKQKKVWVPLIENRPIYNPKPYYNW